MSDVNLSAAGPSQGANRAPSGGSAAAKAASVGVRLRAAGPSQGRLHERGEAQARSARPRVLAAADAMLLHHADRRKEAAWSHFPSGGSEMAPAASVGIHQ
jgi:hypothetical protein